MGHDDLLGEDLFTSELDDDFLSDDATPEENDPFSDEGLDDLESLDGDTEDDDYNGGYNPEEWN